MTNPNQQNHTVPPEVIIEEQIHLLNDNAFTAIGFNLIISMVFFTLMRELIPFSLLVTWLAAIYTTMAMRSVITTVIKRTPLTPMNTRTRARLLILGTTITGILWGIAGVLVMIYGTTDKHTMIVFILAGMSAGAMATTGALTVAYLLFILPMLIPLNLMFYLAGDPEHLLMGAMTTLYILILLISFKNYQQLLCRSITLGYKNLQILDQLKHKNSQLNKNEQKMRDITSKLAEGVVVLNKDGMVSYMNPEAERLLGWSADQLIGKSLHQYIHADINSDPDHKGDCNLIKALNGIHTYRIEDEQFVHQNGTHFPVSFIVAPMSADDDEQAMVLSFQDISERKNNEKILKDSKKRFQDVAMISADWIWETDSNGRYAYISSRVEDILGFKSEELLGKTIFDLMTDQEAEQAQQVFAETIANRKPFIDQESWILSKDGQQVCLLSNGIPLLDDSGNFVGYRGVNKDITEQKLLQAEITHTATHDELTGLLNRHTLSTLFDDEIIRCNRYARAFSIFLIDIDHFKKINDSHGHDAGDNILKGIARLMQQSIRNTDHIARYGGEEFLIILPETHSNGAITLAERLRRDIEAQIFELNNDETMSITASIGISCYPQHGSGQKSLLIAADKALYRAKENGRNRVSIAFDPAVSA